jgi:hypothetical protein
MLIALAGCQVVSLVGCTTGCGGGPRPQLGTVEGVVTLDGVPLAAATVRFTPHGPGRTAQGVTDASGRYRLLYLRDVPGANVDRHVVRITTASDETHGVESLPPRYHRRSQLEAVVRLGRNWHDFALESSTTPP